MRVQLLAIVGLSGCPDYVCDDTLTFGGGCIAGHWCEERGDDFEYGQAFFLSTDGDDVWRCEGSDCAWVLLSMADYCVERLDLLPAG